MITNIADYFTKGCGRCKYFATPDCKVLKWAMGLADLRVICRELDLTETAKWGHPCYMRGKRNVVIIGSFRDDFRLTFFKAALMKDPEDILIKKGPNTQTADMIIFTRNDDVARMEKVVRSYIEEAIGYADSGIEPPKVKVEFELPGELVEAFDDDPKLAEAFHQLTPGRQRSYVINLSSAKTSKTRSARILKFRDKIMLGKGALER